MITAKITKVTDDKLEYLGLFDADSGAVPNVGDSIFFNGPQQLWVIERHWTIYTSGKEKILELFVQDHSPLSEAKETTGAGKQ